MRIRDSQCETCIYRPDSFQDLESLETEVRDPIAPFHFDRWRACHEDLSHDEVCAGFAARHGNDCTPIQIYRRLEAAAMASENDKNVGGGGGA